MTTVLITEQEGYMSDSMTDGHRGGACAGQRHPAGCGQTLSVFITQEAPLGWRLKHIVLLAPGWQSQARGEVHMERGGSWMNGEGWLDGHTNL